MVNPITQSRARATIPPKCPGSALPGAVQNCRIWAARICESWLVVGAFCAVTSENGECLCSEAAGRGMM